MSTIFCYFSEQSVFLSSLSKQSFWAVFLGSLSERLSWSVVVWAFFLGSLPQHAAQHTSSPLRLWSAPSCTGLPAGRTRGTCLLATCVVAHDEATALQATAASADGPQERQDSFQERQASLACCVVLLLKCVVRYRLFSGACAARVCDLRWGPQELVLLEYMASAELNQALRQSFHSRRQGGRQEGQGLGQVREADSPDRQGGRAQPGEQPAAR